MVLKKWPDDPRVVLDYSEVMLPVEFILGHYAVFDPWPDQSDPPVYDGFELGKEAAATCLQVPDLLTVEGRQGSEEQGRSIGDEMLGVAFRLGMEQGRRVLIEKLMSRRINPVSALEIETGLHPQTVLREMIEWPKSR